MNHQLLGVGRAGQASTSQVPATVPSGSAGVCGVFAVQDHFGKWFRVADMFSCVISLLQRKLMPLWRRGGGVASPGVPLRPGPGHMLHAATGQLAVTAAVVVAVLAAVLVAGRGVRRLLVRRQLARRVTYDLLPSTSFDPSAEDVARFAHQLARTRPAVAWLRPRRGASIRIRLYTDGEGRLSYQISGPASAGSVMRHQSYAQVELREADAEGQLSAGDD